MLKQIEKDILTIKEGVLTHQVNCFGVMGSGIAKAIRDKWPQVYTSYQTFCLDAKDTQNLLGKYQVITVETNLMLANIFGQLNYGRDGKQYTDYTAVNKALYSLSSFLKTYPEQKQVYVPYKMGCGLGGGDWDIYTAIIAKHFPTAIVCKLPE